MNFKKGDKVLCINDQFDFHGHKSIDTWAFNMIQKFPLRLEVYTVRNPHKNRESIFLAEIINPILINANGRQMEEPSWNNHRFVTLPKYSYHDSQVDEKQMRLDLFLEAEISTTEVSLEKII
jgi:hypothetical protein